MVEKFSGGKSCEIDRNCSVGQKSQRAICRSRAVIFVKVTEGSESTTGVSTLVTPSGYTPTELPFYRGATNKRM